MKVPVGTIDYRYPTSGVVVVIAEISTAFRQAHHALIEKYAMPGKADSIKQQHWWKAEYNVTILGDWFAVEFPSDQDLTLFLLKWS